MRLRHTLLLAIITILLAACNFTLAEDVTPPPGYVPPTPMPTLGPLYPASAPDVLNGAMIYAEKCAPCHGVTGLGDGEQGKQLPITVAPIGLADTAQKAKPSAWYTQVTQGNLDRFMPPFTSLSDQERWDVVAYAFTLHTTPDQIETGKNLFNANCAGDCADKFKNIEMMAALSENDIVGMIKGGEGNFGPDLTDDEALAVAAYIRTLTVISPHAQLTAVPATETPVAAEAGTPSAETTPVDGTQAAATSEATALPQVGNISGKLENQTGKKLPSDAVVILRGYEHGDDPSAGPVEVVTLEGAPNTDGTYLFENVEIPVDRIYLADIQVDGMTYQSEYVVVKPGMTELTLSPIVVQATTEDFTVLKVESVQMYFDFAVEGNVQIFAIYSITNNSDKVVVVKMAADEKVPFIAFPDGAEGKGYQASQDSAPFQSTADGFAMPPSERPYGLIAFASMPKTKEIAVSQAVLLPIGEFAVFLPEGVDADGKTLTDDGIQPIQTTNFHVYKGGAFKDGDKIEFTITGKPKDSTAVNPDVTQNQPLLIGIGVFGVTLILAGAWMFMRDRRKAAVEVDEDAEDNDDEDEFEDTETIMDAIIALDDLHRAGKISDEAYKQRRTELKNALKRKA